jgi:hypothetical protein
MLRTAATLPAAIAISIAAAGTAATVAQLKRNTNGMARTVRKVLMRLGLSHCRRFASGSNAR